MGGKKMFFSSSKKPLSITLVNTINLDTVFGTAYQDYRGSYMSPDGRYYIANIYSGVERFSRIEMSVYGDLSSTLTATNYTKYNNTPVGVGFSSDGLKCYNYSLGDTMYQKNLTTPFAPQPQSNLGAGTVGYNISMAANYHATIWLNSDGTKFYFAITNNGTETTSPNSILEVSVSIPYDYGSTKTTFTCHLNDLSGYGLLKSFTFINSGNNFIALTTDGYLLFYSLPAPYLLTSKTLINIVYTGSSAISINAYNDDYIYVLSLSNDLKQYSITF